MERMNLILHNMVYVLYICIFDIQDYNNIRKDIGHTYIIEFVQIFESYNNHILL